MLLSDIIGPVRQHPRILVAIPIVIALAAVTYSGWLVWQVRSDLDDAQGSAGTLRSAIDEEDVQGRDRALGDLRSSTTAAADRTDGLWWSVMTHAPLVGDDATGIRALSTSLEVVVAEGLEPLADSIDELDRLSSGGRVDLAVVHRLADPVERAHRAFSAANDDVSGLDSSGYAGSLKLRFDRYVDLIGSTSGALASAEKATKVLPTMLGADGPQNYLLIFQNNAEIRATGGMPGSWALLHADKGELSLTRQGTAGDFPHQSRPLLPVSGAERQVYGSQLGTYFQDAGFTPDFPRAAELWAAHWKVRFPAVALDGVVALDPVALSYIAGGTGPVQVADRTLTTDNMVEELLSRPYLELEPEEQDVFFAHAARAVFEAATGDLASPLELVKGLHRSAAEGRLLVSAFDADVRSELAGTAVEGALSAGDTHVPQVDIGLNDATGSKMSYYLRYWADVKATSCVAGAQKLAASMTLNQSISPQDAADLPESVTGGGHFGTEPGSQLVLVRVQGPAGGSLDEVRMNGKSLDRNLQVVQLDGRPVMTLVVLLSNRKDVVINWTMGTGPGQTGDVALEMTPSVVRGSKHATKATAC